MQAPKKQEDDVTLDVINEIFLEDTPEYHRIKELAEKDIAKELMDSIEKFLAHKDEPEVEEIKKVVFEDASKVSDDNINSIVDAFVRIRDDNSLETIDKKSINDILILFNHWVAIGNGQQEISVPTDIFNNSKTEKKQKSLLDLEEQVMAIRKPEHEELYKTHSSSFPANDLYAGQEQRLYDRSSSSDFILGSANNSEGYRSNSLYKNHGGRVDTS